MKAIGTITVGLLLTGAAFGAPVQWSSSVGGNDHWYEVCPDHLSWDQFNLVATTSSYNGAPGYAVSILSDAENEFLFETFFNTTDQLWIGYTDVAQEGTWVWSSGEPTTYTHWAPGEPNNTGGDEDFAVLILAYDNPSFWNDVGADARQLGIIEYDNVPEPASCALILCGLTGLAALAFAAAKL